MLPAPQLTAKASRRDRTASRTLSRNSRSVEVVAQPHHQLHRRDDLRRWMLSGGADER